MRVIAGQHRGRGLQSPKGSGTRPTTDRVRESLFSSIASLRGGFDGAVVLDAFAGSGALGIEALSRGASYCCFCERDRAALAVLRANTSFLPRESYRIMGGDVLKRTLTAPHPFDLAFFDPPYSLDAGLLVGFVNDLSCASLLCAGAIVSYERDANEPSGALLGCAPAIELVAEKRYGNTAIDFYRL